MKSFRLNPVVLQWIGTFASVLLLSLSTPAFSAGGGGTFDFSAWDALLKKYVRPAMSADIRFNAVDYKNLKTDVEFSRLIDRLAAFSPDRLQGRDEKLAFWINLYNIMAVKMVLDHFPVKSIKDAGNLLRPVWDKPVGVVGGKERTLSGIEHGILRTMGEPRVHFAIVCASVSCPDLRVEAYAAERLETQLRDQTARFLANPGKGLRIERDNKRARVSSIFKWYAEDFQEQGGVAGFAAGFLPPDQQAILKSGGLVIDYLGYNWDLNY
jgi:hypothetical protein